MAKETAVEAVEEAKHSKNALILSKRFSDNIDLLGVILDDNTQYSIAEVEEKIQNYLKGVIK